MSQHQYRRDVDGLRAIAVLCVVAYHAFPDLLRGGFVGVDVFFVISGYLITRILLNGISQGRFSLGEFYGRRIRRIFPALIAVMSAVLAFSWFWLLPGEFSALGLHVVGGAGFFSNFLLWSEVGYFNVNADLKPLLHLWSLGIEEQFYILWPLVLVLSVRFKFHLPYVFGTLIALSLWTSLYWVVKDPATAFYLPLTRFWELMAGGVLAWHHLANRTEPASTNRKNANFMSLAGVGLLICGVGLIKPSSAFPGVWALLPVIGAFLIIHAGPSAWINRVILSNRALVFIGLISYPLYLWHWPILSLARIVNSEPLTAFPKIGLVGASVLLASLTYQFLEKPIRSSKSPMVPIFFLTASMVLLATAGFACYKWQGFPSRMNVELRPFSTFLPNFQEDGRTGKCWLGSDAKRDAFAAECIDNLNSGARPLVVVWGDSHAARFFPGLKQTVNTGFRLAQWTRDACPPILNYSDEHCIEGNQYILEQIENLKPDVLIVFAAWNRYQGQSPGSFPIAEFQNTLDKLITLGIPKLIVIGPAPQWANDLPGALVRHALNHGRVQVPERTYVGFDESSRRADTVFQTALGTLKGVTYFSALNAMCDTAGCLTTINGRADGLTSWDYGHLTTPGAQFVAEKLLVSVSKDFAKKPVLPTALKEGPSVQGNFDR